MSVKVSRKKPRNYILSLLYRINKLIILPPKVKLRLLLDLEWTFDRLAHEQSFNLYSVDDHPARLYSKQFILSEVRSNHRVLDLGCKFGEMSYYLASATRQVVGIDHDPGAIKVARQKHKRENLEFVCADAKDFLQKSLERFDVLILSHILEHLDDPSDFLEQFRAHFEFIYIEVPDFEKSYLNLYRSDINSRLIYTDDDHVTEFDREDLMKVLTNSRIKVLRSEFRFGVMKFWCTTIDS